MLFYFTDFGIPLVSVFSILFFIPLSLLAFYLTPQHKRDYATIAITVVFIVFVSPLQLITLGALILANYVIIKEANEVSITQNKYSQMLLVISTAINIVVWLFFVFSKNFRGYYYLVGGGVIPVLLIDTNLKIYRGKLEEAPNLKRYFAHVFFFPKLFVGPFTSINSNNENIVENSIQSNLATGLKLFAFGLFQYQFLGIRLIGLARTLKEFNIKDTTMLSAWVMAVALILGLYHSLVGLSTVSRGVSALFGKNYTADYSPPFEYKSITDFATGFNRSLIKLISEGLAFDKNKGILSFLTFAAIIILAGIWLDFSLSFMLVALLILGFIALEGFFLTGKQGQNKQWLHRLLVVACVVAIAVVLAYGYSGWNNDIIKTFFSIKVGIKNYNAHQKIIYYINAYLFVLLTAAVFMTPIPKKINSFLTLRMPAVYNVALTCISVLLVLASLTLVV